MACDSKVLCSNTSAYLPQSGYHYSNEKFWYNETIAAVCCGVLDFTNSNGFSQWKDILEESIDHINYHNTKNMECLRLDLIKNLKQYGASQTQMIVADASIRRVLLINYNYTSEVLSISQNGDPFAQVFGYYPVDLQLFFKDIKNNLNDFSLEKIKTLAEKYIRVNYDVSTFIEKSVSSVDSPIGGNIHLLSLNNKGYTNYENVSIESK